MNGWFPGFGLFRSTLKREPKNAFTAPRGDGGRQSGGRIRP